MPRWPCSNRRWPLSQGAGAKVVEDARPATSLEEMTATYLTLLTSIFGAAYSDDVRSFLDEVAAATDPEDRSVDSVMARGLVASHRSWLRANERRHHIQREWAQLFADVDVMLTPVTPVAAIPHDTERPLNERSIEVNGALATYMSQLVWAGLATMPLLPATAIPAGRTGAGLPVGLQIMGPRYSDRTNLRVAGWAEAVLGGFTPPPGA